MSSEFGAQALVEGSGLGFRVDSVARAFNRFGGVGLKDLFGNSGDWVPLPNVLYRRLGLRACVRRVGPPVGPSLWRFPNSPMSRRDGRNVETSSPNKCLQNP